MSYTVDLSTVPTTELAAPAVGVIVLEQQGYGPPGPPGPQGDPGAGMLPGGTAGQVQVKQSAADYDMAWASAVTPTVHAATHASGGSDPVTLDQSQVTGLTAALGGKATDTAVVHLAGAETVAGAKTFTSPVVVTGASLAVGTSPATTGIVRLPAQTYINWRNFANTANNGIGIGMNAIGFMEIAAETAMVFITQSAQRLSIGGDLGFSEGMHLTFGTATGSKIGTSASQRLAFYGATPIVRPTATPPAAADPATTMALVNDLRTKLISLGLIA
jgi:hypothetical protein